MSYAAYERLERTSERKHEYLAGLVYAMAGGTPEHDALADNVRHHLRLGLTDRPCGVHGSDLKIRVDAVDVATYADAAVVCDRRERSPVDGLAVTNPRVLVEVTSPSTEAYDRGEKFDHYRHLPALEAYVLVAHDRELIEVYTRAGEGWHLRSARAGERAAIEPLGLELPVEGVYRDPIDGSSLARPSTGREPVRG